MPSQYRSTDTLVFGGGLKVKRNVFGRRKTPYELWELVRRYVRRHGRHKFLRIADQVRTLERSQAASAAAQSAISQLPRYILESNVNLYDNADDYEFKDDFTRAPAVDKRVFYECAVHTALLPFPFGEEEDAAPAGSITDLLKGSQEDNSKKKTKSTFGKKDKKEKDKSDQPSPIATDAAMADIPFDLTTDILKTRLSGSTILDLKRRTKAILATLQKRPKLYPEEELLAKCLGTFYDNVLEKSGKRLEGRRVYDLCRVFMKTVTEHTASIKDKNKGQKEEFCFQYFQKLVREVAEGGGTLERTASETLALAREAKLDAQGLLEWLRTVMSWQPNEHRALIEKHTEHAISTAIIGLKARLSDFASNPANPARFTSEDEFRTWIDGETTKTRELQGLFVTAAAKQPKFLVRISCNKPLAGLFVHINGTLAYKNEDGWRLGAGDSISFSVWDDKEAIGKEKGKNFLGSKSVAFNGNPQTVKFEKGVELSIIAERAPEFDTDIDHEDAYRLLLQQCIESDTLYNLGQNGEYSLSRLSDALLYCYSLRWGVSDTSRMMMLIEYLLPKYANRTISLGPLYLAFQPMAEAEATNQLVFNRAEKERWLKLLTSMEGIFRFHILNYRMTFPYNSPENELDQVLYMLRMTYESPLFKLARPDVKPWSIELPTMVQVGAVQRFQMLHALANPVVSNMYGRVLEMLKLFLEEYNTEKVYFLKSFTRYNVDSVHLSMQVYIRYLALEMDNIWMIGRKCWRQRKALPSSLVFTLYDMSKVVKEKLSAYNDLLDYIEISRWFSPFVFLFLDMTGLKSRDIQANAARLDDFEAISEVVLHSSSILDVFSFFHQTLDWLRKLNWPDEVYQAKFMGRLGAIYTSCIDMYAATLKARIDETLAKDVITEDDRRRMCVQLNNIETARSQLNDLHETMDIERLQEVLVQHAGRAPDSPTDMVLPALERGVSGTFEASLSAHFPLHPKIYGLVAQAYFTFVHPVTGLGLGHCSPDQTVDLALSPSAEAIIVELRYSNALGDQIIGKTYFAVDESFDDHDTHEVTAEFLGIGKITVRMKKMGEKVNDIEFFFRRSFRSLKRTVQDALFTKLIVPSMMAELERLIEKYDRHMVTNVAEFGPKSVYRSSPYMMITDDVIGMELNAAFDVLGDTLGYLSQHLYEDVLKLFVRKLWKDFCVSTETQVLLSPLRYLTIKQITVALNVLDTFKAFLFGSFFSLVLDISETHTIIESGTGELVQLKHLDETPEYKRLLLLIEIYPLPTVELIARHEREPSSTILTLLKYRSGPEESAFVGKLEKAKWDAMVAQQQQQQPSSAASGTTGPVSGLAR
ncbi:hypothetical protein BC828DRAFT_59735 [Blastocladiella britannica]|nr:hypothetical protein BC828DRAFT_59735 [Blastocladiella britannica]